MVADVTLPDRVESTQVEAAFAERDLDGQSSQGRKCQATSNHGHCRRSAGLIAARELTSTWIPSTINQCGVWHDEYRQSHHPRECRVGARGRHSARWPPIVWSIACRLYTPPIDIHEGPEGLTLEADLPGATEQNLRIQLEENILSLYARIDSPTPEKARLVHEEYRLGDYHRSFILSDEVDRDRITADLKNGVLRLFLPKAERARPAGSRSRREIDPACFAQNTATTGLAVMPIFLFPTLPVTDLW